MSSSKNKSILTRDMLTAGTAFGTGMFSQPMVSSGMWFMLSILCLFFIVHKLIICVVPLRSRFKVFNQMLVLIYL